MLKFRKGAYPYIFFRCLVLEQQASGWVEPVHCLNYYAGPKKIFQFFQFFFKVTELFECRRG